MPVHGTIIVLAGNTCHSQQDRLTRFPSSRVTPYFQLEMQNHHFQYRGSAMLYIQASSLCVHPATHIVYSPLGEQSYLAYRRVTHNEGFRLLRARIFWRSHLTAVLCSHHQLFPVDLQQQELATQPVTARSASSLPAAASGDQRIRPRIVAAADADRFSNQTPSSGR